MHFTLDQSGVLFWGHRYARNVEGVIPVLWKIYLASKSMWDKFLHDTYLTLLLELDGKETANTSPSLTIIYSY